MDPHSISCEPNPQNPYESRQIFVILNDKRIEGKYEQDPEDPNKMVE